MNIRKIPINIIFILCVFVVSAFYTINAFSLSFGTFRSPGPGFIPRIAGIMAMIISAILLFLDIRKLASGKTYEETESIAFPLRPILFILSFVFYAIVFKPLGYVISTIIFTFILCMIMRDKWWLSLIISISTGIAFYVIFSLLAVPLPLGVLG